MTVVVLVVLAVIYWLTGGQMFNPGPLAAAHADIEDCAACHQPLNTSQGELCMECHSEIRLEIAAETGLHARVKNAASCLNCHPDHRGANFDMRTAAVDHFDHEQALFSLSRHTLDYDQSPFECRDCHSPAGFNADLLACLDCHENAAPEFMQPHVAAFGLNCLECHDGVDRMSGFNHAETDFPLTGNHEALDCASCHQDGQFADTPLDCAACHVEPGAHAGLFPATCGDCHNPAGWTPALLHGISFDHFKETGFSLVRHETHFDGSSLNCKVCHVNSLDTFDGQTCEQCHTSGNASFMTLHLADFGPNCLDCHDGLDSMNNFDHNSVFLLDGAHSALACTNCHADNRFKGTPEACSDCHSEPELHAGLFGLQCDSCHSTNAWQPAALTRHSFPLDHGDEGVIACATCHPSTFVQYTCDLCHEPLKMVEEHSDKDIFNIAARCLECHPTGLKDEKED